MGGEDGAGGVPFTCVVRPESLMEGGGAVHGNILCDMVAVFLCM